MTAATKPPCLYPLPDGRRCCECDNCQSHDAATVPDDIHLLRSVLTYGGVKEVIGRDLHERSMQALHRLQHATFLVPHEDEAPDAPRGE